MLLEKIPKYCDIVRVESALDEPQWSCFGSAKKIFFVENRLYYISDKSFYLQTSFVVQLVFCISIFTNISAKKEIQTHHPSLRRLTALPS